MVSNISILIVGLVTLTLGAEALVRGSASLALRLGLSSIVIGLTVVAFGTSTPELVVSINAAVNNLTDISVGNVIGSNIFNIGVILGVTAMICPVKVGLQIIRQDGPIMLAASVFSSILIMKGSISRISGMFLFSALVIYTAYAVLTARKQVGEKIEKQFEEGVPPVSSSLLKDFMFIGGGLVLLVTGSQLLVVSASSIARIFGLSEAVIGLTIVAAGTSMPELATSLVAAMRRQPDIAIGNIIGSNIFNIFGILGLTAIMKPISVSGITKLDLWVMIAFSVALLPMLFTKLKLERWEGVLLLAGYCLYISALWP
ncbi:MAG: calcium/sodium antiporter [Pseudomonadota bacterium]